MGNSGRFPQERPAATASSYPILIYYKVHAGSFHVSIIHRTLTWTTLSLTCLRDPYYACVYAPGVGHTDSESAEHFRLGQFSQMFIVLLTQTGFEPLVFGAGVRATPSPLRKTHPEITGLEHSLLLSYYYHYYDHISIIIIIVFLLSYYYH